MREIKFRGQDTRNGKWVYGGIDTDWGLPHEQRERYWIIGPYYSAVFVNPETVGQFTGLHDKNGKEIYEGDIVKSDELKFPLEIKFVPEHAAFLLLGTDDKDERKYYEYAEAARCQRNMTIVGNIYENPELEVK